MFATAWSTLSVRPSVCRVAGGLEGRAIQKAGGGASAAPHHVTGRGQRRERSGEEQGRLRQGEVQRGLGAGAVVVSPAGGRCWVV